MDVYSFLNSSDVADYLRYKEYEFNAAEAAYIVYHSDTLTLDEKIAAWQEIVDTMPDCPLCSSAYDPYFESAHNSELQFLKDLIFVEKIKLKRFMDSEGCYYVPSRSRYVLEEAAKYRRSEYFPWRNAVINVFSSFDKCVDNLRCHDKETSLYDRHIITKRKIDADGNYDTCGAVTLDGQFRVLEIDWHYPSLLDCDFERLDYKDVDWHLRHASIELPVPFRRGDIVVDRTAFDQRPFVFDCLKFWDFSTLIEHGHVLGAERPKVTYRKFYDRVDYDCKDESYMSVLGWNMASTWYYEGGPQLLDYGHGVCKNYLNLEYYRKPLEGDFRLLEVVSRWVRGEMDLGLAIGNAALIAAEGRASTLRFELERVYHHGGII